MEKKKSQQKNQGLWYEHSWLLTLQQPLTSSASLGLVGVDLDGATKIFLCLEFLPKLSCAQQQESLPQNIFFQESPRTLLLCF